ncbi:hypothetical protein [Motilimonas pumila]|uniref:Uncharacterized protein n=1 Tax=Motilimonas pumila TaxID=2303987 RepID=A0A418YIG1_9GAMM|nr:hypothetical protein [Motilimonas pumila]RJG50433.1 hypothetical protein D1Z90_02845 [Motilimonas pumila]
MTSPTLLVIDRQGQPCDYSYPPEQGEQIAAINQTLIKQKCDTLWLTIKVQTNAQESLDQLFACLRQLYRPLMRQKGCHFWVCWQGQTDPMSEAGAKALTQIAALELAAKQVSINFVSTTERMPDAKRQALLDWPQSRYYTAQSMSLTEG